MTPDCAILFLHYQNDAVTRQNFASFCEANPEMPIHAVSTGERLLGGMSVLDHPESRRRWAQHVEHDPQLLARSSDLIVYLWYAFLRTPEQAAERWFLVEWDAYCQQSVRAFGARVWDLPVSGPRVIWPNVDPGWSWFKFTESLPLPLRDFTAGISPLCFILIADELLQQVVSAVPWDQLGITNGEMRFATLCVSQGVHPAANPYAGPFITWKPLIIPRGLHDAVRMYHPIKTLYPRLPAGDFPHKQEAEFAGWSIFEDDYHWLLRFALERGIKNVVEFGPGDSSLAFLDAGCRVVSYEHDAAYARQARERFAAFSGIEIRACAKDGVPVVEELPFPPDLIFVDGPPCEQGAEVSRLAQCEWALATGAIVILHDALRHQEQETLRQLTASGLMMELEIIPTQKGLAVMRRAATLPLARGGD